MLRAAIAFWVGVAALSQPAWAAANCKYDRTSFVYGQDVQAQVVARSGLPCPILFRSARNRSEWSIAAAPSHGVLVPEGARGWNYTPTRGYSGPDAFTIEVSGETMGRYVQTGSSKTAFAVKVIP